MPASRALEDGDEVAIADECGPGEAALRARLAGDGALGLAIVVGITLSLGLRGALPGVRTPLY